MTPWLLVSGDFVRTGGMDRANHALAEHLAQQGEEVHLVAHGADDTLLRCPNVTLHHAAKPLNSYYLGRRNIDRLGRHWAAKIADRGGYVVVNGGNCAWSDVNWVHYVHAAYTPQPAGGFLKRLVGHWKRRAFLAEERKSIVSARLLIANSMRTRQDLIDRLGVDESRIKTVYLGADPEEFQPATSDQRIAIRTDLGWPADRPVALFVGALGDQRKGLDTVLRAWRKLCGQGNWNAMLAVVGQGAGVEELRAQARRDQIDSQITFMGFRKDVGRLIRAADLMVAPARYEPYGLSVHEALCSAVPAIISACSGVCERLPLEARDLILQDPGDADELAERLLAWRSERARYRALMVALSQTLRQRSWMRMAEEMVRVIRTPNTTQTGRPAVRMSA